jgi:hypothetical protein
VGDYDTMQILITESKYTATFRTHCICGLSRATVSNTASIFYKGECSNKKVSHVFQVEIN